MSQTVNQKPAGQTVESSKFLSWDDTKSSPDKTSVFTGAEIAAQNNAAISNAVTIASGAVTTANQAKVQSQSAFDIATIIQQLKPSFGWNAITNFPAISNASGQDRDSCICTDGADRNLGAGLETWNDGDIMFWDTLALRWKTGGNIATVLTLATVADAANRKAVTALILTALQNSPNPLTGTNPAADVQYVDAQVAVVAAQISAASVITIRQFNTIQSYEVDGHSSGLNISTPLSTYYNLAQARSRFPNTYALRQGQFDLTWNYSTAVFQESVATLAYDRYSRIQTEDNKIWLLNKDIIFPSNGKINPNPNRDSYQYLIDLGGQMVVDIRNLSGPLFDKTPANESDAANIDIESKWQLQHLRMFNDNVVAGSIGMRFGSSKGFKLEDVNIYQFDIAFLGSLLLRSKFVDCEFAEGSTGLKTGAGWWSGASLNADVSQPKINACRFREITGVGLYLGGVDTPNIYDCQFEGNGGTYAIYLDNASSSVTKNSKITMPRFENESKWSEALIGVRGTDTFAFNVSEVFHQATVAGTVLVESNSLGGETRVRLRNNYNSGGNTTWRLADIGNGGSTCWDVASTLFAGQPRTEAEFIASDLVWDLTKTNSRKPTNNRVDYIERLPTP